MKAQAVRTLRKLIDRWSAECDESYAYDSHFDGGEWSGPAHARLYEDGFGRILGMVALKYGVSRVWLSNQYEELNHYEEHKYFDAHKSV